MLFSRNGGKNISENSTYKIAHFLPDLIYVFIGHCPSKFYEKSSFLSWKCVILRYIITECYCNMLSLPLLGQLWISKLFSVRKSIHVVILFNLKRDRCKKHFNAGLTLCSISSFYEIGQNSHFCFGGSWSRKIPLTLAVVKRITCSNSTMETPEKYVNSAQS